MPFKESAPNFEVVQPILGEGEVISIGSAVLNSEKEDNPRILLQNAKGHFTLIEDMLGQHGESIPENWTVGDTLAYFISAYVETLSYDKFTLKQGGTEDRSVTFFPQFSGQGSTISFEVVGPTTLYQGEINIPSESGINPLAGLPTSVRKSVEIPISERTAGQPSLKTVGSLSMSDFLVDQ